ncbi:MAG: hypothetical protein AAF871_14530 [Pseudomonadota bacterium]
MANVNQKKFSLRMNKINRRHARLSRGYVMSVNHDGLVVAEPRARGSIIPWRGILFLLCGALLVKGVMFAQIGEDAYDARVASLAAGNQIEQAGAYVLGADPVTRWIGAQVAPYLPGPEAAAAEELTPAAVVVE